MTGEFYGDGRCEVVGENGTTVWVGCPLVVSGDKFVLG